MTNAVSAPGAPTSRSDTPSPLTSPMDATLNPNCALAPAGLGILASVGTNTPTWAEQQTPRQKSTTRSIDDMTPPLVRSLAIEKAKPNGRIWGNEGALYQGNARWSRSERQQ